MRLKANLYPTARYRVLADIDKCLEFILCVEQEVEGGAGLVSVAEFVTPSPILSFRCVSAEKRMVKQTAEGMEASMEEDQMENADMRDKTTNISLAQETD